MSASGPVSSHRLYRNKAFILCVLVAGNHRPPLLFVILSFEFLQPLAFLIKIHVSKHFFINSLWISFSCVFKLVKSLILVVRELQMAHDHIILLRLPPNSLLCIFFIKHKVLIDSLLRRYRLSLHHSALDRTLN